MTGLRRLYVSFIAIVVNANSEDVVHSISVELDGQKLTLNFGENEDYKSKAKDFILQYGLHEAAGKPLDRVAEDFVVAMSDQVAFEVATAASFDKRSFEISLTPKLDLIVVDDLLDHPYAMRQFGLSCDFRYKGNHPGQRTVSYANHLAFRPLRRKVEELVGEPLPYWFASFQRSFSNDTDNGVHSKQCPPGPTLCLRNTS